MKKILSIILSLCMVMSYMPTIVFADDVEIESAFSDAEFKQYIADAGFDKDGDGYLSQDEINDVKGVNFGEYGSYALGKDYIVNDVKGLEYFTALEYLNCYGLSGISKIDVSNNVALKELVCSKTGITEIDVSKNANLERLYCDYTGITKIDVSKNANLKNLEFSFTDITKIDVSKNTNLESLSCSGSGITKLDIKNNTALKTLICDDTGITKLDVSKNTNLSTIDISSTKISNIDFSNNKNLAYIYCNYTKISNIDISSAEHFNSIECCYSGIKALKLPENLVRCVTNDNVSSEFCTYNKSSDKYEYDLSKVSGIDLTKVNNCNVSDGSYDASTGIVTLNSDSAVFTYRYDTGISYYPLNITINLFSDISCDDAVWFPDEQFRAYIKDAGFDEDGNGKLSQTELSKVNTINITEFNSLSKKYEVKDFTGIEYFTNLNVLICYGAEITALDVSKNTNLINLDCSGTGITDIDVSKNTNLLNLTCYNTGITELDLSNNANLSALNCHDTGITALDLSNNASLNQLSCYNTGITALDLSNNANLSKLSCYNTGITALDLSTNVNLNELNCYNTEITALDLSTNVNLSKLTCFNTGITALDLSTNVNLNELSCYNTGITALDLSTNVNLSKLTCSNTGITALDLSTNANLKDLDYQYCKLKLAKFPNSLKNVISGENSWTENLLFSDFTAGKYEFDFSESFGLDLSKVSNVSVSNGGGYDENTGIVTLVSDKSTLSYTYDTGNETYPLVVSCELHVGGELDYNDTTLFPDEQFRQFISGTSIDANFNGTLSLDEINAVTEIDIASKATYDIVNFKGIEYFTNLKKLNCNGKTSVTEVDVSKNAKLEILYLEGTNVSNIDVSKNLELKELDLTNLHNLENLDLSTNDKLEKLYILSTKITEIKLDNCSNLTFLNCDETGISELDLSQNTKLKELLCTGTDITELNLKSCSELERVLCSSTGISELDLSQCPNLHELNCSYTKISELDLSQCPNLHELNCSYTKISELDLSKNTKLEKINCSDTDIENIDLSGITTSHDFYAENNKLKAAKFNNNLHVLVNYGSLLKERAVFNSETGKFEYDLSKVKGIDLSKVYDFDLGKAGSYDRNTGIVALEGKDCEFVYLYNTGNASNQLRVVIELSIEFDYNDVSLFPDEQFRTYIKDVIDKDGSGKLNAEELNGVASIDITKDNIATGKDYYVENFKGIEYFVNLSVILCTNITTLKTLDVSKNTDLRVIYCDGCSGLSTLDVSKNKYLTDLCINDTEISNIDLTKNSYLENFSCVNSKITELDLSQNINLISLICASTKINKLNLDANVNLEFLDCFEMDIEELKLDNNKKLVNLDCSETKIKELDLSQNVDLVYFTCTANEIEMLDLSQNTKLDFINVSMSKLKSIKLFNGTITDFMSYDNISNENCVYNESNGKYEFDISKFKGVDISKISEASVTNGGVYDKTTGIVSFDRFGDGTAQFTYKYDTDCLGKSLTPEIILNLGGKQTLTLANFKYTEPVDLIYDGTAKVATVVPNVSGIGEITIKYFDKNGTEKTPIDVGEYTVKISVLDGDVFKATTEDIEIGKFNVVPRNVTIKADDVVITYGNDVSELTYTITDGSIVEGDQISGNLEISNIPVSASGKYSAGTYTDVVLQGTLAINDNYNIIFIEGDVAVGRRPVVVEWSGTDGLVYDGALKIIYATCKNVLDGDTLNMILGGDVEATEQGQYNAYVKSIDNEDYTISDGAVGVSKDWAISADSNEIMEFEIDDWIYGNSPSQPMATAKYGMPTFEYSDKENGAFTGNVPTNAGTYYVRAKVSGTGSYSEATKTIPFKILSREFSGSVLDISDQFYTGVAVEPKLTVLDGENTLVKDRDYTVRYSNNVEVGEVTANITFIGNYSGTVTKKFNIVTKPFSGTIFDISDQTYTGSPIEPSLSIEFEGKSLVKDVDYTVSFLNNVNAGEATAEINFIGFYSGTTTKSFNIVPKAFSGTISDISDQGYTGRAVEPRLKVVENGKTLDKGIDYTVSFLNNVNIGEATAEVTFIGNYFGATTKKFNVVPKRDFGGSISDILHQTYTGKPIEPELVVFDGEKVLDLDTDYTVSFLNNVNVGEATAEVTFIGVYSGSISKKFSILPAEAEISEKPIASDVYVGEELFNSIISGGKVVGFGEELETVFEWKNGLEILDSVGTFEKTVVATPKNTNFKPFEFNVSVGAIEEESNKRHHKGSSTSYLIDFESNGGSKVVSKRVGKNSTIYEPTKPTKEGFTFDGWYVDKAFEEKFDFDTIITENMTLYAKWNEGKEILDESNDDLKQIILTVGELETIVFGEKKINDVAPKIVGERSMLPTRFVAENLGANVLWEEKKKKVTISGNDVVIELFVDSDVATVNGKEVRLDSIAFVENGRIYTPLRFVAENLGAKVDWIAESKKVVITVK